MALLIFSAPAAGAGLSQERGPVSADQRQHWRHFSTTPVGPRGAFHVLSCCRDSPVILSVHFHFHLTSFQSHLSKITVASCKGASRLITTSKNVNQKKMKKIGVTEIFIELKDKTITLILSDQGLGNQTH
jgi:hypothetical protein